MSGNSIAMDAMTNSQIKSISAGFVASVIVNKPECHPVIDTKNQDDTIYEAQNLRFEGSPSAMVQQS